MPITLQDLYKARKRGSSLIQKTPLRVCPWLSEATGTSVYLKLDNLQEIGSFKIRGSSNKLLSLSDEQKTRGVVTFSTGNHGLAVSYVAQRLGIRAVVCLSRRVPRERIDALEYLGAEVMVHGSSQDDAMALAFSLEREEGLTLINPIDDLAIIAGHGTLGLELLEDCPEVDTVLVPVSGGALISGIAFALKTADPAIRVIGISMDRAPVMYRSLQAGQPIELEEKETIAVSLVGGIGLNNKYTFQMVQTYVDDFVLVSDEEIANGVLFAFEKHHQVVEGAGAVSIAALLYRKVFNIGRRVVAVVSGGNLEFSLFQKIAQQSLLK
jgi:threonine dehydratase